MVSFVVSEEWKQAYPGASAGVLILKNVSNGRPPLELRARVQAIESDIKARYSGWDRAALAELPILQAYSAYYRRFKKTYHVQLQLESLVIKGRSLPRATALLEMMFSAELKNLLLTAGHDLEAVQGTLSLDVSQGSESYETISGETKTLKLGDMFIADQAGVISSIIYGPDRRTRLTDLTTEALFTVYAPEGIPPEAVRQHLEDIWDGVLLASPAGRVEMLAVITA
jgi:DNA/RNA-binding domain of Phe-tRNA-synthetase-like protein